MARLTLKAIRRFFFFWRWRLRHGRAGTSVLLWVLILLFFVLCYYLGIDLMVREKPYHYEFSYPVHTPDLRFQQIVWHSRFHPNSSYAHLALFRRYAKLGFRAYPLKEKSCDGKDLLILVRSAPGNFENRAAIRETWGTDEAGGVLFLVGVPDVQEEETYSRLKEEKRKYNDLVIIPTPDTLLSKLTKTVMGIRFAAEVCTGSGKWEHSLIIDDDYFLSVKRLRKFLAGEGAVERFYGGLVVPESKPSRHRIWNEGFVSIEEYPFSHFPPYVTPGAVVLSKEALLEIHAATSFVKPFRLEDIYLGICTRKLGIKPTEIKGFKLGSEEDDNSEELIAAPGFSPDRLRRSWKG